MALAGEAYKKTFGIIGTGINTPLEIDYASGMTSRCCFKLPVLASATTTDDLENDITSFYFGYSDIVTSTQLDLMDSDDNVVQDLNTSGASWTTYAFGFHENGGKKYTGVTIDWHDFLDTFDTGAYYVRCTATLATSGTFVETSFTYCVDYYTASRADHTVRVDFYHNGIIGNRDLDTDKISFKDLNWYNQIRIPRAIILKERSENDQESVQYTNGMMEDWKSEQTIIWDLEIAEAPNWLHRYLNLEVFQADNIYVTDYNANCPLAPFNKRNVVRKGGYDPNWIEINKRPSVTITLSPKYSNHRKLWS